MITIVILRISDSLLNYNFPPELFQWRNSFRIRFNRINFSTYTNMCNSNVIYFLHDVFALIANVH